MRLVDETKRLLSECGLRPRRSLGQNFCVDEELLKRMASYANLQADDVVLEVGAGFGFLTRELSDSAGRVIAVEFDPKLLKILGDSLRGMVGERFLFISDSQWTVKTHRSALAEVRYSGASLRHS